MTERPEGASDREPIEPEGDLDEPRIDDADVDEIETELEEAEAEADELDDEGVATEDEEIAPLGDEELEADEAQPTGAGGALAGAAAAPTVRRRAVPGTVQRAPTQSELAVRVTDNASRLFVLATVVIFVAILAFGILAGNGGLLTKTPPPEPTPSASIAPSASPSAGASESAAPSSASPESAAPSSATPSETGASASPS